MTSKDLENIKEDPKIRCLPDRFLAYVKWGVDNIERESHIPHDRKKGESYKPFKEYLKGEKEDDMTQEEVALWRKQSFDQTVNNVRLSYAAHGRLGNTANPKILAAGLMYVLALRCGIYLTQNEIARSFDLSPVSIRSGYIAVRQSK